MPKSLEQLMAARASLLDQLIHDIAMERGHDLSNGLAPDLRTDLAHEADVLIEDYHEYVFGTGDTKPTRSIEAIMSKILKIDALLMDTIERERDPGTQLM